MNRMKTLEIMRKREGKGPRESIIDFISIHISNLMEMCMRYSKQREAINAFAKVSVSETYFKLNVRLYEIDRKVFEDTFYLSNEPWLLECYHDNFPCIVDYIKKKLIISGCECHSKIEYPTIQFEFEWIKK